MTEESATPLLESELFCDEDFPASNASLYDKDGVTLRWKRPHELSPTPQMFVDGCSRADVHQGELGDCWFLSACAAVAQGKHTKRKLDWGPDRAWMMSSYIDDDCSELIKEVIPSGQVLYGDGYTGKVSFRFWRMGQWETVQIDDRLPLNKKGELVYAHCGDRNEFWLPLMEKAFAKFHGKYSRLEGGLLDEGLLSLTGALVKTIDVAEESFFQIIRDEYQAGALVLCGSRRVADEKHLIVPSHAYTITGLASFVQDEQRVRLLRVRNPWGTQEWTGAWSDDDANWNHVAPEIKNMLLETRDDWDGEAWMNVSDFMESYSQVTTAKIIPQADGLRLCASVGRWETYYNAGGSPTDIQNFSTNPQYLLTVNEADEKAEWLDEETEDNETALVRIELIQEHDRSKYRQLYPIGLSIYKTTDPEARITAEEMVHEVGYPAVSDNSNILRREALTPGYYIIVPFLSQSNLSRGFLLRAYGANPMKLQELENSRDRS